MRKTIIMVVANICVLWAPAAVAEVPLSKAAETRLCEALQAVKPGEHIPIIVTGVYAAGFELSVLYDPEEPACLWDVQPSTWVELSEAVRSNAELLRQIEKNRGALVRFKGELFGPKPIGPDNLALAPNLAWANRAGGLRYGHLSAFRTKLLVQAILEVSPVPKSQLSSGVWQKPRSEQSLPGVRHAEMPHYPLKARQAGIAGHVTVEVTIKAGRVAQTLVKSGDRMLAVETEENIKTWEFGPSVDATLTTTFMYLLEPRLSGAAEHPRVELQLPSLVRITEGINGW